ncbi:MAG TPA: hypothetical protein PLT45_02310, partial [Smithella sp.]|nr:hypothetical protein [Smithella sp.]
MTRRLTSRNFVFFLAVLAGLLFPQASAWTQGLMIPALAMVMTLAVLNVPNHYFRNVRAILVPSLAGIGMTYVLLSGVLLALSALVITDEAVRIGFVLIAAVPPAVAVIPFTALLKGDVSYTLSGTVAAYLAALLAVPLMFGLFIETGFDRSNQLVLILMELIVLPLLLSRVILRFQWEEKILPIRGFLTDWGFFIVLYSMIGVNRNLIFSQPLKILPIAAVAFGSTFLLGWLIRKTGHLLKMGEGKTVSLVLLGTLKNQGLAGGLAVTLFAKETAL